MSEQTTNAARHREGGGEVSRGHSRQTVEGPNPLAQGAVWAISQIVEQQQGIMEQLELFEQVGSVIRPVTIGDDAIGSEVNEERQAVTAVEQQRALTQQLMERVSKSRFWEKLPDPSNT